MSMWTLLILYQLKHFLADYPLQSNMYMLGKFRDKDWVRPLLAHALVHGAGTAIICYVAGKNDLAFPLAIFDTTVHFIMDRIKAGKAWLGRFKALSAAEMMRVLSMSSVDNDAQQLQKRLLRHNTYFWWSLGLDQMVHHLTHYCCIFWILTH